MNDNKGKQYLFERDYWKFRSLTYKFAVIVLAIIILILLGTLIYTVYKYKEKKPIVITVNEKTGRAKYIDPKAVSIEGTIRDSLEIECFVKDYFYFLFTYNKLTTKDNLEKIINWTAKEALVDIKNNINFKKRGQYISQGKQSKIKINKFLILNADDMVKINIQVDFTEAIYNFRNEVEEFNKTAIIKIKTIERSLINPQGFLVIAYTEYNDNKNKKNNMEEITE